MLHWWFTAKPSATRLAASAERSFDITTRSAPCQTAAKSAINETMAVIGTWPFHAPCALSSNSAGSRRRRTLSAASPLACMVAVIGPLGLTAKRTIGSPIRRNASTVTRLSLPPPTGTRDRLGRSAASGVSSGAAPTSRM
ncbi:MAG: hypothetical protein EA356_05045 [Geminicoccaceae bacterium]|nr:MAG: hypothetical protein EA356_05045 [Geminicoccaceae bacterium]